jgi:hypothetical protein
MKEEIIEELNELSPLLAHSKVQYMYNDLPEKYFNHLQEIVLSEIKLSTELGTKKHYDDLPKAYFDSLADTVFHKINKEKKSRVLSIYKNIKWVAIAASFIGVFLFINKVDFMSNDQKGLVKSDSYQEILNELSEDDIDVLLKEFSTEEDFQYIKTNNNIEHINFTPLLSDELEEGYLEEELNEEDIEYLKTIM